MRMLSAAHALAEAIGLTGTATVQDYPTRPTT